MELFAFFFIILPQMYQDAPKSDQFKIETFWKDNHMEGYSVPQEIAIKGMLLQKDRFTEKVGNVKTLKCGRLESVRMVKSNTTE